PEDRMSWERYRSRNVPLLAKLTDAYGACAIVARDGERAVGMLRFYPKAICEIDGAGHLCLQQDHPAGPTDDFADRPFPPLSDIHDKTLVVHCMMTGSPQQKENPYQRRGVGTRMAKALIAWAKDHGWERIEATAFEDIPILYEITGDAGHTFWEKIGFRIIDRRSLTELQERSEFVMKIEEQAKSLGIDPERAKEQLVMRLDLA
ncbi:MAG TPA: GNAT family N-acetyltransferase, partial [Sumerlaeia bacterium]|nr:GNAT family N-acetyltransferase [Sumerlaeia bacterium]